MRFIMEYGFDVKDGQGREAQTWLQGNEEELAKLCPAGMEYLGTYSAIYSSEKGVGSTKTYWRLDSYAAQDRFAAAMQEGGRFAQLMEEFTETFVDQSNDANKSNGLFKAVVDASIWAE